jgi:hypothetical protein
MEKDEFMRWLKEELEKYELTEYGWEMMTNMLVEEIQEETNGI